MIVENVEMRPDGYIGMVVSGLHPEEPDGHLVLFQSEALIDRRDRYGLTTPEECISALVREQAVRLNELPFVPSDPVRHPDYGIMHDHGGTCVDIDVAFSEKAQRQITEASS